MDAALKFGEAIEGFRSGNIVVGICPGAYMPVPACETAFALARRFETEIAEKKISITVVFPETVRTAFGDAKIFGELEWAFEKHDIEPVENFPVSEITEDKILTEDGRAMNHDLLMLVPRFKDRK